MAYRALSSSFVEKYARPPSQTIVDQAISIHQNVRALLGDSEYATLLQGSYKNDTALWDMNDVDIVAVSRGFVSCHFTGATSSNGVSWDEIFSRIERKLQSDYRYQGKWTRGDKCIRLNTGVKVDIVPAVRIADANEDPVSIFSFRERSERRNWPRSHYEAGAVKSGRTNGIYKQTVRLFKRWVRCWFNDHKVAPSYYIECLMHSQSDDSLRGDLASAFVSIADNIGRINYDSVMLPRVAGEGDLFSSHEWTRENFKKFQQTLLQALPFAQRASNASSEMSARSNWIAAFNGQQPS